jgi:hypothetical protein
MAAIDSNSGNTPAQWKNDFTPLDGHTAKLPGIVNSAYNGG